MIKLCIFDMDGTLVDSVPDITTGVNNALKAEGLPEKTQIQVKNAVGNGVVHLLKSSIPEGTYSDALLQKLRDGFTREYGAHCTEQTRVFEGLTELLRLLKSKGVKLAVNTNKPHIFLDKIMKGFFAEIGFDMLVGAGEYPNKPDPSAVHAILSELGVRKSECVYIGDSGVDIHTARNAGIGSIGVTWGYRERQELAEAGADMIVDTADALCRGLQKMLAQ